MMTRELIEKFYSGSCSEEERQSITEWFRNNPVELENYFSEAEWKSFVFNEQLDFQVSDSIRNEIYRKTQRKASIISMFKKVAVAASVAFLLGIGWILFIKESGGHKENLLSKVVIADTLNSSKDVIVLLLPDSSLVKLQPGGRLQFANPFSKNVRDVTLKGEALFEVAKDPSKPFTVYSDEIATTALGTKFSVTALPGAAVIKVKLMEGKVVVKAADSVNRRFMKDHYLLPGDEFEFNREKLTGLVKRSNNDAAENSIKKNEKSAPAEISNWYMFNNQELFQVLDQLEVIYKVRIEYSKKDIKGISFIGRVDKSDTIENILNDIALLNNLLVRKEGNRYFITKK